jgi:diacylglycerol kinase (ATP)
MRFAIAFGVIGLTLGTLAVRTTFEHGWLLAFVEGDLSLCFLGLAVIYGLRATGIEIERILDKPGWSPLIRLVLLPQLALGSVVLFVGRWFDREGLLNPLADGIFVGQLPFPSERSKIEAAGIGAVLNLCWKYPPASKLNRASDLISAHVPILDACPPTDRQFREAVETVERWRSEGRCVLIHCAQGHGRTATVSAAVMVRLGLAVDVAQALAMVQAARPLAKPSSEQKAALIRFCGIHPLLQDH